VLTSHRPGLLIYDRKGFIMPFKFRDETAGRDLLYIDNAGQLGLGSLPNSGQALTVLGISVLSPDARLQDGMLRAGAPAAYSGSVSAPVGTSATVAISTTQNPTVTSTVNPDSITTTAVVFPGNGSSTTYSIW
jgi:hypothetical protein